MNSRIALPRVDTKETTPLFPSISILLPFEPKMVSKAELQQNLRRITVNLREELKKEYPREQVIQIFHRIETLIRELNYFTYTKSLAIFLSAGVEKVYYVDIPLEEKLIIDDSFDLRHLVEYKTAPQDFLMLALSNRCNRIFLANPDQLVRIVSNAPRNLQHHKNEMPIGSDIAIERQLQKESAFRKFLRYTDDALNILLDAYPLPLFVVGNRKATGNFKQLTRNQSRIIDYIDSDFGDASEAVLREAIKPHIADWQAVKERDLLNRAKAAAASGKLAAGMREVWNEADRKKGKLLIVEKNYSNPSFEGGRVRGMFTEEKSPRAPFYIKDEVDDIIGKVLENGGDVEFVEDGRLRQYNKIALILSH